MLDTILACDSRILELLVSIDLLNDLPAPPKSHDQHRPPRTQCCKPAVVLDLRRVHPCSPVPHAIPVIPKNS